MFLAIRLVRALFVFGLILGSYLAQLGLQRVFRRRALEGSKRDHVLPDWLKRRRRRVDARNAERLLRGMLRLRGVFIKLGQVLSIMGGFLPRVYAKTLEQLQDQVPAQPFARIAKAVERELGRPPADVFRDIEELPIAAASLGQVHVAHLQDGT